MKTRRIAALLLVLSATACNRQPAPGDAKIGTDVEVQTKDRATVAGRVVEVQPETLVIERLDTRARTSIARGDIASIRLAGASPDPPATVQVDKSRDSDRVADTPSAVVDSGTVPAEKETPPTRELTVPAGTVLALTLETPVASDRSRVEDAVRARTRSAITIDGVEALPAGSTVVGTVTEAQRSAKVKGRARVAVRFHTIRAEGSNYDIKTSSYAREAPGTKKKDAAKIGIPAAGGAVIGAIAGGKKGAAIGGAIGGGAGTAAVLTTRGEEVELPAGGRISVRLTAPLIVRVPAG